MKFTPCQSRCASDGSRCLGCGRFLSEILETGALTHRILQLIQQQAFQNPEHYLQSLSADILNALHNPD